MLPFLDKSGAKVQLFNLIMYKGKDFFCFIVVYFEALRNKNPSTEISRGAMVGAKSVYSSVPMRIFIISTAE